jgi:methyl-accepting chemotaxis protein
MASAGRERLPRKAALGETVNVGVRGKLLAGFGTVMVFLLFVGAIGIYGVKQAGAGLTAVADVEMPGVIAVLEADVAAMQMQRDLRQMMLVTSPADMAKAREAYLAAEKTYNHHLEDLGGLLQTPQAKATLSELKKASAAWATARTRILDAATKNDMDAAHAAVLSDDNVKSLAAVNGLLTDLVKAKEAHALVIGEEAHQMERTAILLTAVATLVATLVAAGVALTLSASIRNGVRDVQTVLTSMTDNCAASLEKALGAMAGGDLTVKVYPVTRPIERMNNDEIGQTARVTNLMLGRLQSTIESYEQARTGVSEVVTQVQELARGVSDSSAQLGDAAGQSSQAITQVAMAVQNIAAGANETSISSQHSSASIAELSRAIDSIARGASEQARQAHAAATTADQMAVKVQRVALDAQHVANTGDATRSSANDGAAAVRETVTGMAEIRTVISDAAGTVESLGRLGEQIGAVVETIDDIAEQTNLLALNAAIEAARAGEHGRGFAVVADEVRKLAERSQRETKAITALIHDVQSHTRDAVSAMQVGSDRVEQGSTRADRAGTALTEILAAVEQMVTQVSGIAASAEEMTSGAREVVGAMESIRAAVEENSAATEQMATQASEVTDSIESIASVAEESSAATEEVSASAEEMSAQAEQVSAQAEELSAVAAELRRLMDRFTVEAQHEQAMSGRQAATGSRRRAA